MEPINLDSIQTVALTSSASPDAEWVGGFFAYGGSGADASVVIQFSIPPGKRLGRHTDTAEESQFILSGSGELLRDEGVAPLRAGDVVVLKPGEAHDLRNTGSEDLRVIGFFSAPQVEQHWTTETWPPDGARVTGSPNRA